MFPLAANLRPFHVIATFDGYCDGDEDGDQQKWNPDRFGVIGDSTPKLLPQSAVCRPDLF
jgi:hypothetical protein